MVGAASVFRIEGRILQENTGDQKVSVHLMITVQKHKRIF
jgi:hypothetical protein